MGLLEFCVGVGLGVFFTYIILYSQVLWLLKTRIDNQNIEERFYIRDNYEFSKKLKKVIR